MAEEKPTEEDIVAVRELKEQGFDSLKIATRLGKKLQHVNACFEIIVTEPRKELRNVSKMQIGHFDKLLESKKEEHLRMKENQDALVMNVRSLWLMVEMLEQKRKYLERTVEDMEKYIKKGSKVADIFIEHEIEN